MHLPWVYKLLLFFWNIQNLRFCYKIYLHINPMFFLCFLIRHWQFKDLLHYKLWSLNFTKSKKKQNKKKPRNFNAHTYLYRYQTVSNIEPIFKSGYFGLTNLSWGRIFWKGNKICLLTSFISSISLLAFFLIKLLICWLLYFKKNYYNAVDNTCFINSRLYSVQPNHWAFTLS